MRSHAFGHDDVGAALAQRIRPAGRIVVEERLERAGDEVRTRQRAVHRGRRSEPCARRGAEDGSVDLGMSKSERERELAPADTPSTAVRSAGSASPSRDRAHRRTSATKNASCAANRRGSNAGEYSWSRSVSSARPVDADDRRRRDVRRLDDRAPLRDQLTVAGEHDRLGHALREVRGDLPTTVVVERLGDERSRVASVCADAWWVTHCEWAATHSDGRRTAFGVRSRPSCIDKE